MLNLKLSLRKQRRFVFEARPVLTLFSTACFAFENYMKMMVLFFSVVAIVWRWCFLFSERGGKRSEPMNFSPESIELLEKLIAPFVLCYSCMGEGVCEYCASETQTLWSLGAEYVWDNMCEEYSRRGCLYCFLHVYSYCHCGMQNTRDMDGRCEACTGTGLQKLHFDFLTPIDFTKNISKTTTVASGKRKATTERQQAKMKKQKMSKRNMQLIQNW